MDKNVSLIPKQLFGEDGMIKDIGEIAVAIVTSISRRTNHQRNMATLSVGLIMEDFNIPLTNTAAKQKIKKGIQELCNCGLIEIEEFSSRRVNDAFDAYVYYETKPFVLLYDQELTLITQHRKMGVSNIKLLMIYLYVVSHISEKTKEPTWVSIENIAAEFNMSERTVRDYMGTLINKIGVLFKKGKKITPSGNTISLHTRNMTEYIHKHRSTYKKSKAVN